MATHPSILAWEIPRTEEPGGLQSVGSQRVRHDEHTRRHLLRGGKYGEGGRQEEPGACAERQRSGWRRGHATQPQAAPLGPQGPSLWGWGWGRHPGGMAEAPSSLEPGRLDAEAA